MKFRKWFVIATLVFSCSFKVLAYEQKLAICAIFQNEASWLKEWIEFHKIQGVEHFYLYNNLSTDNYEAVLDEYIKKGEVTLIQWPKTGYYGLQCLAYEHCIKLTSRKVKWLAVIDTDEFLFSPKGMDLREYLKRFEIRRDVGGVCVNWQCFGTSGVENLGEGELLIEKLLLHAPLASNRRNFRVKSIVRPERTKQSYGPHCFKYKKRCIGVDPNFKIVIDKFDNCDVPVNNIRINHYILRTLDWAYSEKVERRMNLWGETKKEGVECIKKWDREYSVEKDAAILIYAERLRQAMGF